MDIIEWMDLKKKNFVHTKEITRSMTEVSNNFTALISTKKIETNYCWTIYVYNHSEIDRCLVKKLEGICLEPETTNL